MATLMENINRAIMAFKNIKSAIEGKGVEVGNAPVEEYADRIAEITTGEGQEVLFSFDGRMYTSKVIIPDGTKSIGGSSYYMCSGLMDISIPDSVTSIGNFAFDSTSITTLTLSENITSVGMQCFRSCKDLTNIHLPSSLNTIGDRAFANCSGLRNVTLGKNFDAKGAVFSAGEFEVDVMIAMFEALKDNTGLEAKTLTLGSTNLAKLTEEQKQIATNKNWNLA